MKATTEAIENLLAIHGLRRVWVSNIKAWQLWRISDGHVCAGSWTFEDSDIPLDTFARRIARVSTGKDINWWRPSRNDTPTVG